MKLCGKTVMTDLEIECAPSMKWTEMIRLEGKELKKCERVVCDELMSALAAYLGFPSTTPLTRATHCHIHMQF